MKPDKSQKVTQIVISLICFTAYITLFAAATAVAFNTNPYSFLRS